VNREELKELGQTIDAIADGAEWECLWELGNWGHPGGRDVEYCIANRIPIRLKPEKTTASAMNVALTIMSLCEGIPPEAQNKCIEMDADDLLKLAEDWQSKNNLLCKILAKCRNSTQHNERLAEKIEDCLLRGANLLRGTKGGKDE
jgi:hypothetical protein